MRILLTSNYKIGAETGSSQVTDLLAFTLSKNHSVCYLCLGEEFKVKKQGNNLLIITVPSVEVNSIAIPLLTPKAILDTESIVSKFSPDIVHTQNSVVISKFVQVWAKQKKIPVVTTFHHVPTQAIRHLLPTLSKNMIAKIIEDMYTQTSLKSFLENIDGVIALNEDQKKDIRKVNKRIKVEVINNGIDFEGFRKIKPKKLKGEIDFIFAGSYTERKNQLFLAKVFKYLPENYNLHCFGKIKSGKAYFDKIKSITPKNVFLNDYDSEISKKYRDYNFFISASTKEVQSLSVIYALASGLPVIGIENETINELVTKRNGLRLKSNLTPKKFAESVIAFIKNSDYKKLSQNALKDAKIFDIKKVALQVEKFYVEVVKNRRVISDN